MQKLTTFRPISTTFNFYLTTFQFSDCFSLPTTLVVTITNTCKTHDKKSVQQEAWINMSSNPTAQQAAAKINDDPAEVVGMAAPAPQTGCKQRFARYSRYGFIRCS